MKIIDKNMKLFGKVSLLDVLIVLVVVAGIIAAVIYFSSHGTGFGGVETQPITYEVMIKKVDYPVIVEGHTDNWPINSDMFPSNWELSMIRAVNVVKFFINDLEITPERLTAAGYGEYSPLVPNTTPENMAKNRRIKIVFIGGGAKGA